MPRIIAYSATSRVERDAPCYRERPPPHRTVRAVFPHTALRVGLVSSVSLPFAPRLRFTLIPMDAPPYGRAVSDAPPHSGLSPIAVFRHYCSRHLICIVPFTRRGPSLHRHYPARALAGGVAVPAAPSLRAIALRRISPLLWPHPTPRFAFATARTPKFLTELSRRVVLLCPARALAVGFAVASGDLPSGLRPSAHAPARPKPIRALGVGFTASELLATRNSSNETLRRRFICIATHLFVRQDSRIRVAPLTACSALRAIPSLRSALTAFGGYVLITSRFVCDSCSFHHDSSAKLILAYQTP